MISREEPRPGIAKSFGFTACPCSLFSPCVFTVSSNAFPLPFLPANSCAFAKALFSVSSAAYRDLAIVASFTEGSIFFWLSTSI